MPVEIFADSTMKTIKCLFVLFIIIVKIFIIIITDKEFRLIIKKIRFFS